MKKQVLFFLFFLVLVSLATADFQDVLEQADKLHDAEDYEQSRNFLEASLSNASGGAEQAELYWRLARAILNLGDEAEDGGASEEEILAFFEEGEALAQKAIDADPNNHLGYYWKSANIGRWGQVKGILNSLFKAKPMRDLLEQAVSVEPEHADSYYVLGQLYEQVPGFPVSFGVEEYAVSLGRKSIDLREQQVKAGIEDELIYDYYTEMAKHLWERDWSASRRKREQSKMMKKYKSISDPMEKNFYYEAVVNLKDQSDEEEAFELIKWTIRELEATANRTGGQEDDLQEAKEELAARQ
jgi:tetratricopeptide (TPR) repeat protein